jgi:ubiquinone/menaquinone biosynthesis C-methylase UbiE
MMIGIASCAVGMMLVFHTAVLRADAFMQPYSQSSSMRHTQRSTIGVRQVTEDTIASDPATIASSPSSQQSREEQLAEQKQKIFGLIRPTKYVDPVLADPITKQPLEISCKRKGRTVQFQLKPLISGNVESRYYEGSVDTYLDLLNPVTPKQETKKDIREERIAWLVRQATPYVPPPLRSVFASTTDGDYVPMRDLFTSPAVSFAYERGWRQGFERAGFPGPDTEAKMASEYFAPAIASVPSNRKSVLVDMSCATGLFTRRFASMGLADRVIGCDYSDSMLTEARRRIREDPKLSRGGGLDLVRLDVGQIPMKDNSVDALHAGAAMHCWPDLDAAASEIYRVLKPGGRYFASTFLSTYFSVLSGVDGQSNTPPSQQAFQYFESIETLSSLLERGGFSREKIMIEVIGTGECVARLQQT